MLPMSCSGCLLCGGICGIGVPRRPREPLSRIGARLHFLEAWPLEGDAELFVVDLPLASVPKLSTAHLSGTTATGG